MTVTTSGVRPIRSAPRATGSVARAKNARVKNGNLLMSASSLLRPLLGQQPTGFAQQLRDHLGSADDGDEVRVTAPAGDDMPWRGPGRRPARRRSQVDADVEAVWAGHVLDHPDGLLG